MGEAVEAYAEATSSTATPTGPLFQRQSSSATQIEGITLAANSTRDSTSASDAVMHISSTRDELPSAHRHPEDAWLPITQSRNATAATSSFHLLCSGIGFQALLLPLALAALGWFWGIICLSVAFVWQLYTIWLLVHLHESVTGTRYSRFLDLSIEAFGVKLGKFFAIVPVGYLSGATCVMLIINGGGTMELFYKTLCGNELRCNSEPSAALWFFFFACLATSLSQFFPNLNSLSRVSLVGAVAAIAYCTLLGALSIAKGRPDGVSYDPSKVATSEMGRVRAILTAFGTIALAFRGHNLVLEIQGTLPSNPKHPPHKPMWRAVTVSYLIIAFCLFSLAIAGYWAYGNKMAAKSGLLNAFLEFHVRKTSKLVVGVVYVLVVVSSLSSFQVYSMPILDNLERIYTGKKNKPCPRWLRAAIKVFFGGMTLFLAVAFPFLGSLAALMGGITLPLTFAYPCFMWTAIKKPRGSDTMWLLNMGLGCAGIGLSVLLVVSAIWNIVCRGIDANFFSP